MARLMEAEGGKVPPSGYKHEYTIEQIAEYNRCEADIFYFIENYVKIIHPVRGAVPFILYEYQRRMIRAYLENEKVVVLTSRQAGKTIVAAIFLLWWSIFKDNQRILIVSKTGASAKDIMERIWYSYEELPWFLKPGVIQDAVQTKEFDNGSKIEALNTTDNTGRGKSISYLMVDECAYIPPGIMAKFYTSVSPTLATGGRCILTSTPNTDEDKFAKIWFSSEMLSYSDSWEDKLADRSKVIDEEIYDTIYETDEIQEKTENDFSSSDVELDDDAIKFVGFHAKWTSVPYKINPDGSIRYRDDGFKKEQFAAGLTDDEWNREFEASFISGDATLISPMKLIGLSQHIRPPRFVDRWGCRWYEEIKPNTAYSVVLDPSEGVDADDACIQVWEIPYLKQVAEWNNNKADQSEQTRMLFRVLRRIYDMQQDDPDHTGDVNLYYSVEKNGLGIGILNAIEYQGESKFPGWLIDSENNPGRGLITTMGSKKRYALEFKSLVERDLFIPRSKRLISQLKTFVRSGQGFRGKRNSKDDVVISCILQCHLIDCIRYHEPDLDDRIRVDTNDYDENDETKPENMAMGIFM